MQLSPSHSSNQRGNRPYRVSDLYNGPSPILGLNFKASWGLLPSAVS